ncbi:hypothetical protein [Azospirillum griseum]|uniref:Uncharacterized protein n=1 Tax=Azospirillum griseum TaxID=2496639 RepID=A0A3S0I0D8_9PROT|nr:hypothetical protein [Azospirillum griseum]RTR19789.1 hypothetical protein EJ903_12340 [Azospirillum griseum]
MSWKNNSNSQNTLLGFSTSTTSDRAHPGMAAHPVALSPERRPLQHQTPALRHEPVVIQRQPTAESPPSHLRLASREELYDTSRGVMALSRVRVRSLSDEDKRDLDLVMAELEREQPPALISAGVTTPPEEQLSIGRNVTQVTFATTAPYKHNPTLNPLTLKSPLFDLAQAIHDDCPDDLIVEILDSQGTRIAVFGTEEEDGVELF